MEMKKPLKLALERQAVAESSVFRETREEAREDAEGYRYYKISVRGSANADDFIEIIRTLPRIVLEHEAFGRLLVNLLGLVTEQQRQISELGHRIEHIARSHVALQAQQSAYEVVERLANQGSDLRGAEVVVRLNASSTSSKSEDRRGEERTNLTDQQKTSVELAATLRTIASLRIGADETLENIRQSLNILERQSRESTAQKYEGDLRIYFDQVTGNPLRQAEADLMRAQAELIRQQAKMTASSADPSASTSSSSSNELPKKAEQ